MSARDEQRAADYLASKPAERPTTAIEAAIGITVILVALGGLCYALIFLP